MSHITERLQEEYYAYKKKCKFTVKNIYNPYKITGIQHRISGANFLVGNKECLINIPDTIQFCKDIEAGLKVPELSRKYKVSQTVIRKMQYTYAFSYYDNWFEIYKKKEMKS